MSPHGARTGVPPRAGRDRRARSNRSRQAPAEHPLAPRVAEMLEISIQAPSLSRGLRSSWQSIQSLVLRRHLLSITLKSEQYWKEVTRYSVDMPHSHVGRLYRRSMPTAIHEHTLARNVSGELGAEECNRAANLIGRAMALRGDVPSLFHPFGKAIRSATRSTRDFPVKGSGNPPRN
jgi:hypothetical protein